MKVRLRDVRDSDLPVFFTQTNDPEGCRMAAFTAKDPSDERWFEDHWARIRRDPAIVMRAVVADDGGDIDDADILGHVSVFGPPEEREVTYWIGRHYWGRGVATAALRALLGIATERPVYARAAADNLASIKVLTNCGFVVSGTGRGFANARGTEIDEVLLTLTD
ncbi:GNAT family N-acetyltransferase [Streptomyces sp. NBC_01281]|uniref:GNAT family N-acetyltransferase n=1 Tax=unclassified Streptomyces TaxID=2593676 RepID=UPI0013BE6224|nr:MULTISPECIES: GNAT family N-acetyltransferase [unclassified Streptomyces]MCX5281603.1 GNAT family N-acetyltransferase [Streptomyces sp. NBC_00198]NEB35283.1 GNAT family N-acetyltransferase [Streptomyces sp. SID14446]WSD75222.1 GNAT family N-acetyltransferase [Streptomyces sp. NBC_01558]WSK58649.1 GNAT family N-acetyltransferase [Streptomyces sp. NBC_01281]